MIKISPSILSANFIDIKNEVTELEKAGADYIHLDVMDGNYVPNITFGPKFIEDLRPVTKLPFDTHLMILNPDNYIEKFAKAGSDIITIHAEATIHLDRSLALIKSFGKKAGLVINPSTHENAIKYVLDKLDLILIMTVNPGFGGQEFIPSQLKKIENIAKMVSDSGRNIEIEVDGGINEKTAKDVKNAGANVLVAGSYIFKGNYKERIDSLRD